MDPLTAAALASWSPSAGVLLTLALSGLLYSRGWRKRRQLVRFSHDSARLGSFLSGLGVLAIALTSPLDALDGLYLSAHMAQHLLLLMIAPPLLLLGQPAIPMLSALPKSFVREGLGPFLRSQTFRHLARCITYMPLTWALFTISTLVWHLPTPYENALRNPQLHNLQHACFFWTGILFWLPVIVQEPGKRRWPSWTVVPYLLFADIINTALAAFFIFSGSILYPTYSVLQSRLLSPRDDQALAGAIMWVPGSIAYLIPAAVFAMRLLSPARMPPAQPQRLRQSARSLAVFRTLPLLRARRFLQYAMLLLAVAICAHGLGGTQTASSNLAGFLPWTYWRALSIAALLIAGNLFCMVCPFTLVRDLGRRWIRPRWHWPHQLRNKWPAIVLLLAYLWAYEAFALWNRPFATAALVIGYFVAAFAIDTSFRGASFCKYICPIGQFHFVSSLLSPREVRIRREETCAQCRTHDCIRGNDRARGCELYLFQPRKASNLDCTFCLDCVQACPHDNVALLPVLPATTLARDPYRSGIGRLSKRTDYAVLALVISFAAFVNAAAMISPVTMQLHRIHAHLGQHGMPIAFAAFVLLGALAIPVVIWRAFGPRELRNRLAFSLVPVGIAMWAAHLLFHLATSTAWLVSFSAPWLTGAQILLLDAGVLLALYLGWKNVEARALRFLPFAIVSLGLYASGVWILFQPMQMRGMVHG